MSSFRQKVDISGKKIREHERNKDNYITKLGRCQIQIFWILDSTSIPIAKETNNSLCMGDRTSNLICIRKGEKFQKTI